MQVKVAFVELVYYGIERKNNLHTDCKQHKS